MFADFTYQRATTAAGDIIDKHLITPKGDPGVFYAANL